MRYCFWLNEANIHGLEMLLLVAPNIDVALRMSGGRDKWLTRAYSTWLISAKENMKREGLTVLH